MNKQTAQQYLDIAKELRVQSLSTDSLMVSIFGDEDEKVQEKLNTDNLSEQILNSMHQCFYALDVEMFGLVVYGPDGPDHLIKVGTEESIYYAQALIDEDCKTT